MQVVPKVSLLQSSEGCRPSIFLSHFWAGCNNVESHFDKNISSCSKSDVFLQCVGDTLEGPFVKTFMFVHKQLHQLARLFQYEEKHAKK
jgi:hypothetical protein